MNNKETGEFLRNFTEREDKYLKLLREKGISLPERLRDWRAWIGDSAIYLNELKNFTEHETAAHRLDR